VTNSDRYNYNCHPCRRVKQRLCNSYHGSSTKQPPAFELIGRLVYEIREGVIPASSVMHGTWLRQWRRDDGHQFRIEKLYRQAYAQLSWLPFNM
jgi:hypothetical protein